MRLRTRMQKTKIRRQSRNFPKIEESQEKAVDVFFAGHSLLALQRLANPKEMEAMSHAIEGASRESDRRENLTAANGFMIPLELFGYGYDKER